VYLVRRSLAGLAERLNPEEFVRVHRRAIVRIGAVQSLRRGPSGELTVLLHSGESIRVGRAFRPAVNRVWREA
jgi:DNA-binding LytR/AlgR family response regulator